MKQKLPIDDPYWKELGRKSGTEKHIDDLDKDLFDVLKEYKALVLEKKSLEVCLDSVNKQINEMSRRLVERYEADEIEKISAHDKTFYLNTFHSCSTVAVTLEDAEKWYLEVHSQETLQQPGLLRYVSFRSVHETGTANEGPPTEEASAEAIRWIRVNELWYENFAAWRKAVIESPPRYTPPPWGGEYPFLDMVSNFIDLKPDVDFLKGDYIIP